MDRFNGQKLCKYKFVIVIVWTGFLQLDLLRLKRRHLPTLHHQLKLQIAMNAIKYTTGAYHIKFHINDQYSYLAHLHMHGTA